MSSDKPLIESVLVIKSPNSDHWLSCVNSCHEFHLICDAMTDISRHGGKSEVEVYFQ